MSSGEEGPPLGTGIDESDGLTVPADESSGLSVPADTPAIIETSVLAATERGVPTELNLSSIAANREEADLRGGVPRIRRMVTAARGSKSADALVQRSQHVCMFVHRE